MANNVITTFSLVNNSKTFFMMPLNIRDKHLYGLRLWSPIRALLVQSVSNKDVLNTLHSHTQLVRSNRNNAVS